MKATISKRASSPAMGWLPDLPDFRDYTSSTKTVSAKLSQLNQKDSPHAMFVKAGVADPAKVKDVDKVDLRQWCSPVEDQSDLGSCTANAGIGLMEYYERKACGRHIDASRLFLYKTTRNLMRMSGDTGGYLRSTMEAMALFGAPPEDFWPYDIAKFDDEPTAFCYSFAQNFQTLQYVRLDPPGTARDILLKTIKSNIRAKIPAMFGFTVYDSIQDAAGGAIPFPGRGEKVLGGHAIVAVGFDEKKKIVNKHGGLTTTGALLIRNSWGAGWGEEGYGWLPYEYVLQGLADDWWTMLKNEWIDTGEFRIED